LLRETQKSRKTQKTKNVISHKKNHRSAAKPHRPTHNTKKTQRKGQKNMDMGKWVNTSFLAINVAGDGVFF
jgi:hypothetical protein